MSKVCNMLVCKVYDIFGLDNMEMPIVQWTLWEWNVDITVSRYKKRKNFVTKDCKMGWYSNTTCK